MIWDWKEERRKLHKQVANAFVSEMLKRPNRKVLPVAKRIGRKFEVSSRTVYRCVAEQRQQADTIGHW